MASNQIIVQGIKNFRFYDVEKASPTFQKIIAKYRSKRKDFKKPKTIMALVEKARFQAENLETENEYMMKELRNDRKFSQELIFLYGQRAEKHYNEINNHKEFKSKVKKNYFFTPSELQNLKSIKNSQNQKDTLPILNKIIFRNHKKSFSPEITNFTFNKENMSYNSSKNSTKMHKFYNTSSNIDSTYNNKTNKKNPDINKLMLSKFTDSNEVKSSKLIDNKSYFNTKTENFRDKILNLTRGNTIYKNKTNNDFRTNRLMYMNKIVKIKDDFSRTKNEFRKLFKTNDYGCNMSKLEYEYISKKYFNS